MVEAMVLGRPSKQLKWLEEGRRWGQERTDGEGGLDRKKATLLLATTVSCWGPGSVLGMPRSTKVKVICGHLHMVAAAVAPDEGSRQRYLFHAATYFLILVVILLNVLLIRIWAAIKEIVFSGYVLSSR